MTERREPTLSGPVADSTSFNEPALDSKTHRNNRTQSAARHHSRPAPVSQRVVEVKSPLSPLAFLASLVALGLTGVLFWQSSGQQQASQALLADLQAAKLRIEQLEQQLTATGDESSQSLAGLAANVKALGGDVKENSSEVRKLWGVAHDRNRKAIESNKNKAASAAKLAASLKTAQQKNQKTVQAALADLQGELAVLSEVQESQQAALSKSQALVANVEAFKTDLSRRVASNEEAVKAIDAFRLQVNRQLIQMSGSATP